MPSLESYQSRSHHKCTCGGDLESTYDERSPIPVHSRQPRRRRKREMVCKECGKRKRFCSPFLCFFSILNVVLIILGAGLAFAAIYTSTLSQFNMEDLRTYEYEFHLRNLMYAIGMGGILAAITGIVGLVVMNPRVGNVPLRVMYELTLLFTGVFLLVVGGLTLVAIFIRERVVDDFFRPLMTQYQHEDPPEIHNTLHRFQGEFSCCGLTKPPDPYAHLQGNARGPLPWSCCVTYNNQALRDAARVQQIIADATSRNCNANDARKHPTFCDKVHPALRYWAFICGLAALGVSLYCFLLMVISCIARRVNRTSYEDRAYGERV